MGAASAGPAADDTARELQKTARRAGAFAVASAAVGFGALAASLAMAPWFNWSTDALSDLGHPRYASAPVFGAGLLAAGLFYVDAALHARRLLGEGKLAKAGVLFLVLGGLSLSAIGVVNEAFGTPHFVVSFTYFTFVPVGMFLLALCIREAQPRLAVATAAMAVAAAAFGISIIAAIVWGAPFTSQAVPELIASALLAAWACGAGLALLRGPFAPVAPRA
jgi:hypothetical membrane protein